MSSAAGSDNNNSSKAKRARDTLSSIYSFYAANRESLERVPSFLSQSSRDVPLFLAPDNVQHTEDEIEDLKKELQEYVQIKEIMEGMSAAEQQLMFQAAYASTIKRN